MAHVSHDCCNGLLSVIMASWGNDMRVFMVVASSIYTPWLNVGLSIDAGLMLGFFSAASTSKLQAFRSVRRIS